MIGKNKTGFRKKEKQKDEFVGCVKMLLTG